MQNVDHAEISKFEALASRWWDTEGDFKPLHDMNPVRLEYIQSKVEIKDKKILDIGCGGGILSESMAASGGDVTGIDMGEAPLSVAKLHSLESGVSVNYQRINAEELAKECPEQFDIVTCMEMLEHVPDPASVIRAACEMVKPGGHVFFSTINRNLKSYLMAIIGAEYILQMLPKGTHEYEKLIKPSELANAARSAELSVKEMKGMHYNPITRKFKLNNDTSVNYIVYTQKES